MNFLCSYQQCYLSSTRSFDTREEMDIFVNKNKNSWNSYSIYKFGNSNYLITELIEIK